MTPSKLIDWMWTPPDSAPRSTILIRFMAGGVFFWEGILKFVYTNQGVGRFTKLGIPAPELTAHLIAVLEIVGGVLLISGFLTRLIAVPFVVEMVVAMLSTKVALYFGTSPLPLPPAPKERSYGQLGMTLATENPIFRKPDARSAVLSRPAARQVWARRGRRGWRGLTSRRQPGSDQPPV